MTTMTKKEYMRIWRAKNRDKVLASKKRYREKYPQAKHYWQLRQRMKWIWYFGSKCEKCGYDKIPEILEFHHFEGIRQSNHSGNPSRRDSTELCYYQTFDYTSVILLCPTCHAEEDYELRKRKLLRKTDSKYILC
jgi:hypothetical protein